MQLRTTAVLRPNVSRKFRLWMSLSRFWIAPKLPAHTQEPGTPHHCTTMGDCVILHIPSFLLSLLPRSPPLHDAAELRRRKKEPGQPQLCVAVLPSLEADTDTGVASRQEPKLYQVRSRQVTSGHQDRTGQDRIVKNNEQAGCVRHRRSHLSWPVQSAEDRCGQGGRIRRESNPVT